jgi:hypothetical protein
MVPGGYTSKEPRVSMILALRLVLLEVRRCTCPVGDYNTRFAGSLTFVTLGLARLLGLPTWYGGKVKVRLLGPWYGQTP